MNDREAQEAADREAENFRIEQARVQEQQRLQDEVACIAAGIAASIV